MSESAPKPSLDGDELLAALEQLPLAAGVIELLPDDLRVRWVNAAGAQALGAASGAPALVAGKRLSALPAVRAQLPALLGHYRAAQASARPSRFEQQSALEAGTAVYNTTALPLASHAGVARFFFVSEDITRRTSLEQLLRAGEAKYRAVFSGAREAIALFNLETLRCVEANEAFLALYGWPRAELLDVTLHQLGDAAQAEQIARDVLARGTVRVHSAMNRRRDGSTFPAECDAHLMQLGERRVLCFFAHDLSAQRQLQEKLLLADRFAAVGTLAAGVAHEVNNPLAYLLANLAFVVERLPELQSAGPALGAALDEMTPALREAITGAQRVKEIVADLKTFSRPELPGGTPVELEPLLDAVLRLLENELKRRAALVREVAPLPRVIGNEARLAQVFLHLLNNALEALPDEDARSNRIRVSAFERGREVVVEVADNGAGIPPEQQRRVFDPFFTTRAVGDGMGLGLSVCHGIVTAMGGRIELSSQPGEGTTVRVTLPRADQEKVRPPSDPNRMAMIALPRLLVIDDEPLLSGAIRRMLLGEAEVVSCTTIDEAFVMLARGDKFDAILCDLMLPGRGGAEFHAELSVTAPQLAARLGFVTGGAVTEEAQAFVRKHADRVLDKPFSRNALRAMVKSLIG